MAMIDTAGAGSMWVDDNKALVQSLRLALCEELAAVNTYERLAEGIRRSGFNPVDTEGKPLPTPEGRLSIQDAKAFAESVLEIARDETRHIGKIQKLIELLDPSVVSTLAEGATEA